MPLRFRKRHRLGLDDTLTGSDGDNVLRPTTLNGGLGADWASYANGAAVTVSLAIAGVQNTGGQGSDTLNSIENLMGSAFNDVLIGGTSANFLEGGAGDDVLAGLAGADTLAGGAGVDTVDYSASGAGVTVNLLTQTASGGDATGDTLSGFENAQGSAFSDTLTGDAGANALSGGGHNDVLGGLAGADALTGGDGVAVWATYAASAAAVTVDLAAGTASGGHADGDTFVAIENISGSVLNDTL